MGLHYVKRTVRVAVTVPFVLAGVLWDEVQWSRSKRRAGYEPGMREWFASTWSDCERVRQGLRHR